MICGFLLFRINKLKPIDCVLRQKALEIIKIKAQKVYLINKKTDLKACYFVLSKVPVNSSYSP